MDKFFPCLVHFTAYSYIYKYIRHLACIKELHTSRKKENITKKQCGKKEISGQLVGYEKSDLNQIQIY